MAKWRTLILALAFLAARPSSLRAQQLTSLPCEDRPTTVDPPWVNARDWCLERVIHDESGGELSFTALAVSSEGILYAARPWAGEIYALTDKDDDGLPETADRVASGLTLPNGLTFYQGALYISGANHLYRLLDERLEILTDSVPSGRGFWTGGLAVGPDERIYVAVGAPCDACSPNGDEADRGAVLSFALDGTDRQTVARGLRQPTDVAFLDDQLWTVDTVRRAITDTEGSDELNRVTPETHFGWPFCAGALNRPDLFPGKFDCSTAVAPALTFPSHSNPLGLVAYQNDLFPSLENSLLVTLGGDTGNPVVVGFSLAVILFNEQGNPQQIRTIIPEQTPDRPSLDLQRIHFQGSGFWPRKPFDVAVSPEGWIYVSSGGGIIYGLRPR